ncbi:hypothetical protein H6P81_016426 [Aristolochia fimbriata]|uniref:Uncharacterized protein n=1 Tax=Aristolochia fimbriata TaxID=158543 RepID=A0AAV7E9K1_ARIFI|nr:hypothetical protein H6P81_016426 [Aristolochia fimbriata]
MFPSASQSSFVVKGKGNETGKASGASANGVGSRSAESGSEDSSEGSDANSQNARQPQYFSSLLHAEREEAVGVDHLGSVTYKVNGILDDKVDEVSGTELRVSCIEQRLRTCQHYIDNQGHTQQSLVITAPKFHKRYILPGKSVNVSAVPKFEDVTQEDEDDWHVLRSALRSTIREAPPSSVRKSRSPSPSPVPRSFAFTDKRSVSPLPTSRPLARSGSLASRSTSPNPVNTGRRYPSVTRKSASMRLPAEKDGQRERDSTPSRSKRLLKALLSRRKTKEFIQPQN